MLINLNIERCRWMLMLITLKNESFLSQFCSKKFKHWASLYQHIDTHRNQSFECDKCSKAFVSRQYSTLHIRNVHTEPMDLQCAIVAMHIACYVKKNSNTITGQA